MIHLDSRLRERGFGKFEGWQTEEVASFMNMTTEEGKLLESDELILDGIYDIEPWSEFSKRVWDSLEDIRANVMGKKALVVAHGGVMRAITLTLSHEQPVFSNGQRIMLRSDGNEWRLLQ